MKKLLKIYEFDNMSQYFEMVVMSTICGQHTQAKNQFKAMPKKERLNFLFSEEAGLLTERQLEAFKMLTL